MELKFHLSYVAADKFDEIRVIHFNDWNACFQFFDFFMKHSFHLLKTRIAQNETKDGIKILASKQTSSFIDILNYMTTGIAILYSDINNLNINNSVYIINKVNFYLI